MNKRPEIGDSVIMRIMGDDVDIEVCDVPQEQPFERTDDCFLIIDQYGEEHIICEDGVDG